MRILHVVASINRDVGGPSVTVTRLASALSEIGVDGTVATLDYPAHGPQLEVPGARVASIGAGRLARALRGWSPEFAEQVVKQASQDVNLIHNHGLWMFPNLYARRAARARRIPFVVSPRGMLDSWAMRRSRLRKFVAWRLFERGNLTCADLFHATSEAEAAAIRSVRLAQPIAVIPNGVDLPTLASVPGRSLLEGTFPALRGRAWLMFLSRLHPKKGVAELLRAWHTVQARHPDHLLLIVGPDLEGYGAAMRQYAREMRLESRVVFTGALYGAMKACALAHADVFVLPTHSENFGVVVAEALAHGTPAITTRAAPWRELEESRCGWWIEDGGDALVVALDTALKLGPSELTAMGARGRALVTQRYAWERIARDMKAAYLWLKGEATCPAFVLER